MSDLLHITREARVLHLTLNRPEKRNALSLELARELVAAFTTASADREVGAILLSANGKSFCAGMDLSELGSVDTQQLTAIHESLFTTGARLTKPIVAAIHGAALAGGTGLVANAHIAVASRDAIFGLTEIRIGLWPLLVYRPVSLAVGERRAVELSLSGRIFAAEEARAMSLIHEIAEDPLARARQIATQLSEYSSFTMKSGLNFVRETRGMSWQDSGNVARRVREEIMNSPDFAAGIAKFRDAD